MNDRVKDCIAERKSENRKYRYMRKTCGVDDVRTERQKEIYMRKKEDARQEVGMALHVHNEMVMKKICEGGNKSGLYAHMKMLIEKGKEKKDRKLELIDDDGETVDDKIMLKAMIEKFWGDLFSMNVDATHGSKKEIVDGGMKNREGFINEKELKRTIKLMKENKATDESGMIAEYVKALGDQDLNNLRRLLNDVLMGGCIPKEWKESRVVLVHKGGSKRELKNYRPVAIINVVCKLFMMVLRERINGWVEESGMLGDIQGGFRMGRRTEDNLFMLERMIEMAKVRKDCLFVAFIDMEKAYDRVNRKKLFEVMRGYGVQGILVDVIERIFSGSMVKFELESIMTAWCKSDSGVRQGCPLSPLLFNIYVRELGMKLAQCKQGFKYLMVNRDGVIEEKSQAGFLYADDVCIMASNEQLLQTIFDNISGCIKEYGMKINGKKSKVVCINGAKEERRWNFGGCKIGEVEEYKYLGVTVKAGLNGGFKSMGDRMVDANGVLGMVKYAAARSGSKYVVGREGWKSMVVNRLMYGCGALVWYQHECDDLEIRQNGMGRWLWDVRNVRNELIRGETGWSTFEEREAKSMVKWMLKVVFEENLVSEIGRACLIELGCKSRWWSRCRHICSKFGLFELVNLIWLREVSLNGMVKLGMKVNWEFWKKHICSRIREVGKQVWKNGFNDTEREK